MGEPHTTDGGWVEVASCPWLHEAELLVSVLDAAGIPAAIPNEYLLGVQPFYATLVGGVRVLVAPEDVVRAREALATANSGANAGDRGDIEIRPAADSDLDGIRSCLEAAFEPYRAAYTLAAFSDTVPTRDGLALRLRRMRVLVAEDDGGRIVGTIAHEIGPSGEGHLRGMAVLPEALGSGIAPRLLAAAEQGLTDAGCLRVTLDTTEPLQRAIRFYEHHGYRPTGRVADFFGMPLVEYAKSLRK